MYYWSDSKTDMTVWPGKKMEETEKNIYSYTLPDGVEYIIFNDGDETQTRDIKLDNKNRKFQNTSEKDSDGHYYVENWDGEKLDTAAANEGIKENINKAVDLVESVLGSEKMSNYKKRDDKYLVVNFDWDEKDNTNKRPEQEMELDISFDGCHITKGTMVTELLSNGFELEHPDRNIQAGYSERPISCKNNSSGREIELRLANSSNEDKKYKDCEISGITFMRNCQGVSYKGLTKDSSLEDVINKLGIPATIGPSPITVNGKENSDDAFIILSYGKYQESQMQIKLAYDPVQNTAKIIDMDYNNTDSIENNNDY